ncbi:unnamed protein product [Dibothriocephalus latus]|uniref:Uncharacterized protein n=1 Tax=Dibothriocephalus latus TaxID=60516 RepID=A0A3P7M0T9_DIBLA|nr:unnamed protein product [Dibothriocephalus latus]
MLSDNKPARPNSLSIPDHADKSVETSSEFRIQRDFVEVVGADSSGTHSSPTVSSNGPNMSPSSEIASSNTEEVVTLRESIRILTEKLSHYEAIIENLEASGSEQAILTARAECEALRAQVSNCEEQLREVRENHRRLIEEARQHRSEVQLLREERDRLEASLLEMQRKHECLLTDCNPPDGAAVCHNVCNFLKICGLREK